jgi:hypothetical protein
MNMPYRVDARLSGRHPFELFLLALSFISGIPALLGAAPEPGSIESSLPAWAAVGWSVCLVGGSGLALIGIYWRQRAAGLILEQLGLAFVGVAALVYAVCIVSVIGATGVLSAGIVAAFGAACLVRWRQIQRVIDAVVVEDARRKGEL